MEWHDRIVVEPKVLAGKPIIKGTRLAAEFVLELLANEWTEQRILENYPQLTHADITAVLNCAARVLKEETVYALPGASPVSSLTRTSPWRQSAVCRRTDTT